MKLIDLRREIHHKMQRLPNHPMVIISQFTDHDEKHVADGYEFSSAVLSLNMGDHSGTHVDAPVHFDARPGAKSIAELPLEDFFTEAVCPRANRSNGARNRSVPGELLQILFQPRLSGGSCGKGHHNRPALAGDHLDDLRIARRGRVVRYIHVFRIHRET
jgi:hypothetical protein